VTERAGYKDRKMTINWNQKLLKNAETGDLAGVKEAIDKGANINIKGSNSDYTALHFVSWHGHEQVAAYLLKQKSIDVNAVDNSGRTALVLTSVYNHHKITQILLEHEDIDISIKGISNLTALDLAKK